MSDEKKIYCVGTREKMSEDSASFACTFCGEAMYLTYLTIERHKDVDWFPSCFECMAQRGPESPLDYLNDPGFQESLRIASERSGLSEEILIDAFLRKMMSVQNEYRERDAGMN